MLAKALPFPVSFFVLHKFTEAHIYPVVPGLRARASLHWQSSHPESPGLSESVSLPGRRKLLFVAGGGVTVLCSPAGF